MNYFKIKENSIICLLCSHFCHLKANQTGICGVNKNMDNRLENLVYGYPVALHVDPIEKKPLYHFLPASRSFSIGTVGCNFRCPFCQNWGISQEHKIDKKRYFSPENIISLALENRCDSIAYTYNEPTIFYPYAKDIALKAREFNLKNIFVTNGFESKEMVEDMSGIIDGVNIDLKSFNFQYYKRELGGNLETVLENLKYIQNLGTWVEVTTLVVPGKNDSDRELREIASFIAKELGVSTPWHISAFYPNYKETKLPATSMQSLENAYGIGKKEGLNYIYIGNAGYENPTVCKNCLCTLIDRKSYEIVENNLINSKCPKCHTELEGVFYEQ